MDEVDAHWVNMAAPGLTLGASDELRFNGTDNTVYVHDLHPYTTIEVR